MRSVYPDKGRRALSMPDPVDISVIVPVYNEEESLPQLQREIRAAVESLGVGWEVIYVDDCSSDASLGVLLELRERCRNVRIVKFRRNYGQTAAMAAGFDVSRGGAVVTLDGDLQNDPADIPRLIAELARGHDLVAGWRKQRHDGFVLRRLPSVIANRLTALVSGILIHDTGCTLKAYRRELIKNMPIYADHHRFLPFMSSGSGARVSEVVVNHRPRLYGKSKYGLGRATRVLLDLLTVKLISQFSQRPLQYFGLLSFGFLTVSVLFASAGLASLSGTSVDAPGGEWQLVVVSVILMLMTLVVYFGLLGLLAELAVKASGMHRRGILDRILNELH